MNYQIAVQVHFIFLEFLPEPIQLYSIFNVHGVHAQLDESQEPFGVDNDAPLAQLVEQLTLNQWVRGSSPRRCTNIKAMPRGAWVDVHTLSRYEKPDERIRRILFAEARSVRRGSESPKVHHPKG